MLCPLSWVITFSFSLLLPHCRIDLCRDTSGCFQSRSYLLNILTGLCCFMYTQGYLQVRPCSVVRLITGSFSSCFSCVHWDVVSVSCIAWPASSSLLAWYLREPATKGHICSESSTRPCSCRSVLGICWILCVSPHWCVWYSRTPSLLSTEGSQS